jgi:hypothetical protein
MEQAPRDQTMKRAGVWQFVALLQATNASCFIQGLMKLLLAMVLEYLLV